MTCLSAVGGKLSLEGPNTMTRSSFAEPLCGGAAALPANPHCGLLLQDRDWGWTYQKLRTPALLWKPSLTAWPLAKYWEGLTF